MPELLYGIADVGGTQERVEVWNGDMELIGAVNGEVDPDDYWGSVESVGHSIKQIANGSGELVATSACVASELDEEGRLILGGILSKWNGQQIGVDIGVVAGVPPERAGVQNDMRAVAESQLAVNATRGIYETGYVITHSSGLGGKPYSNRSNVIGYDSPGHAELGGDAKCPCGGVGHVEAYVSGNGSILNHGVRLEERLNDRGAASEFVLNLSTAMIALIERNRNAGFGLEVIRWMGGVATGQPVLRARAEENVREVLSARIGEGEVPVWETVTLGAKAGLHGSFIDAQRRANAA